MKRHYLYAFSVQPHAWPAGKEGSGSAESLCHELARHPWCNHVEATPEDHGYHMRVDTSRADVGDELLGSCGEQGFRIESVPTMVECEE